MDIRRRVVVVLCLLALVLLPPSTALAWANGPNYGNGFGTHDWVLEEADNLARSHGVTWLNESLALPATDDPDTVFHDTTHHVYDIWGDTYGDAPTTIAARYSSAVAFLKAGNVASASVDAGLLSHYYSDICDPLHTDQTVAEESVHSAYEDAIDDITTAAGIHREWITDDGFTAATDPAARAIAAATSAHADYATLVTGFASGGLPAVEPITQRALTRAVNDLADILESIERDAGAGAGDPSRTMITISASPKRVALPKTFVLSGVLSPGKMSDPCKVDVRRPGKSYWSYSSARLAYALTTDGGAKWWYRYTPKLAGTYYFRVRFVGDLTRQKCLSATVAVVVTKAGSTSTAPATTVTSVYITNTGSKYHRGTCGYLSKSKIAISLSEAKRRGYTPCSVCKPPS